MDSFQFDEISITKFNAWMDGGTITFNCTSKSGANFEIEITQHVILEIPERMLGKRKLPGRIYLNDSIVPLRSELEKKLISEFKEVIYSQGGLGKMEKGCLVEHIEYIESDEYLLNSRNHSK